MAEVASIYLPEKMLDTAEDCALVGFNFSGFLFVVIKAVPRKQFESFAHLQTLVQANKQKSFNWYCAGSPMILGHLDMKGNTESDDMAEFRSDKKLWLSLTRTGVNFTMRELTICGQAYSPRQHFIIYPHMKYA